MEASKLFVDFVVFLVSFMLLRMYVRCYKEDEELIPKLVGIIGFLGTIIMLWIYTYATIGHDIAELIGKGY